jgi:hypothetical protein
MEQCEAAALSRMQSWRRVISWVDEQPANRQPVLRAFAEGWIEHDSFLSEEKPAYTVRRHADDLGPIDRNDETGHN